MTKDAREVHTRGRGGGESTGRAAASAQCTGRAPLFRYLVRLRLSCRGTQGSEPDSCQVRRSGSFVSGATYQMDLQAPRVGPEVRESVYCRQVDTPQRRARKDIHRRGHAGRRAEDEPLETSVAVAAGSGAQRNRRGDSWVLDIHSG
jgi:hypothetical protein